MSIGMCFNDDVPWGVSKENKRLGMSVKEVYDSLDQLDRLKESYKELREECLKLQRIIGEADMDMKRTAEISKEKVEQIFDEARKNDVFKINRLGKWHYKAEDIDIMRTMNQLDFYRSKYINMQIHEALMKGENNMNAVYNDLANGKAAYLVTDNGKVPVKIENLTTHYEYGCTVMNFEGRMLTLDDPITRWVVANKNTPTTKLPGIKAVHFSGPVTAVIWDDKTKTIVRCSDGEFVDYEKGLAMAIAKKALGTNKSGSNYYDIFKKWLATLEDNHIGFGPEPKEDLDENLKNATEIVEEVVETPAPKKRKSKKVVEEKQDG